MEKNKDLLCKCNNRQVIPSKERETVSWVQSVCLLQLSSLTCWGKTFGERPKRGYSRNIQFFAECLNQLLLSCPALYKQAVNVQHTRVCARIPLPVGMRTGSLWAAGAARGEQHHLHFQLSRAWSRSRSMLWPSPRHFKFLIIWFYERSPESYTLSSQMASLLQYP